MSVVPVPLVRPLHEFPAEPPHPPLTYSAQPPKSRVRLERDAGGVTLTILPSSVCSLLPPYLGMSAISAVVFVGNVLLPQHGPPAALLAERPAAFAAWVGVWAALTVANTVMGLPLHLLLRHTTTVRWDEDFLRVRTRRWCWRRQRQWPRTSVMGVRVTWLDWVALLDDQGRVLCRLGVPERADVRWACVVVRDLIENRSADSPAADFAPPAPAR